jgi:dTDP-glucose pyrophosphorylase
MIISKNFTIKKCLKLMSAKGFKTLIIADKNKRLLGTITDGDIRKYLLKNFKLNSKIDLIYNSNPKFLFEKDLVFQNIKNIFLKLKIDTLPIVTNEKKIKKILHINDFFSEKTKNFLSYNDISVVIMAGGEGLRFRPFTSIFPKPLIPIKNKTLIQHIIELFDEKDFKKITLILNYKSNVIVTFLKSLRLKRKFNFLIEKKTLGTAGGLSLLKRVSDDFVLINCDTIIKADINDIVKFHKINFYDITLVVSNKKFKISYGCCQIDNNGNFNGIIEKPELDFFSNTGMYIINKKILKFVKKNQKLDMTNLIKILLKNKIKIGTYPIHEDDWIDVGKWQDYEKNYSKI